ncbi:MAG TPA: sigma-70 family RNA polymerase sigma factor [Acidimicrobiia bacterium]|nr:sigma-70 family RNA polymerase sigma factor [Acidimicrobiia bacterium]
MREPGDVDPNQLVERIRGGDSEAFDALYRAYVQRVHHAIRARVWDSDAASDLTQEVFLRAFERLDELRDPERLGPWLLSIARNAATDYGRRAARNDRLVPSEEFELPDPAHGPDKLAELLELADLVNGCLVNLSKRDATALNLAMHFGLGPEEVASVLDISTGAAKVVLHRARRRLRAAISVKLLTLTARSECPELAVLRAEGEDTVILQHVHCCQRCKDVASRQVQA